MTWLEKGSLTTLRKTGTPRGRAPCSSMDRAPLSQGEDAGSSPVEAWEAGVVRDARFLLLVTPAVLRSHRVTAASLTSKSDHTACD